MSFSKLVTEDRKLVAADVEAALNPVEAEGVFRDRRECSVLALAGGVRALGLAPPAPRPKKPGQ